MNLAKVDNEEGDSKDDEGMMLNGDEGDEVVCFPQSIMLSPKQGEQEQNHQIFRTKCKVNDKVCNMIMDSGNSKNKVSKQLVKALNLSVEKHPALYRIRWIKKETMTRCNEGMSCIFFNWQNL